MTGASPHETSREANGGITEGTPIRLGLCLAAYGSTGLRSALAEAADHGPLCLDLPTDTTLGLVDARRCFDDTDYRDEVAGVLAGVAAGLASHVRQQQPRCPASARPAWSAHRPGIAGDREGQARSWAAVRGWLDQDRTADRGHNGAVARWLPGFRALAVLVGKRR